MFLLRLKKVANLRILCKVWNIFQVAATQIYIFLNYLIQKKMLFLS